MFLGRGTLKYTVNLKGNTHTIKYVYDLVDNWHFATCFYCIYLIHKIHKRNENQLWLWFWKHPHFNRLVIIGIQLVDTRHCFNVYKMSIRRCQHCIDVLKMLKQRCVSTGQQIKGYKSIINGLIEIISAIKQYYIYKLYPTKILKKMIFWPFIVSKKILKPAHYCL